MSNLCLVVDDSKVVRKVVIKMIEPLGFAIAEAGDGAEAVAQCQAAMPRLVILDWNMPVMDGLTFLKSLRAMPGGDAPVVIMCTTENDFAKIQEAIMSGANEYVMKPFDEEIIKGKLSQLGLIN